MPKVITGYVQSRKVVEGNICTWSTFVIWSSTSAKGRAGSGCGEGTGEKPAGQGSCIRAGYIEQLVKSTTDQCGRVHHCTVGSMLIHCMGFG